MTAGQDVLDDGRARAERNGVELDWVEADAESLPFEDESFDVVMTTFGATFAPRHAWLPRGWPEFLCECRAASHQDDSDDE